MIQPRKIIMLRCLAMFLWVPFDGVSAAGQTSGFVYVASNWSYDVSAYTIDGTTGGLTLVSGSPFSAGTQPVAVTVDPTGKFVYVVNYDNGFDPGNVSAYTINGATGALTAVPGSPFPAGFLPYSITIDATGHFAYVANAGSNDVSAYRIDGTTGALTAIPGSPFPAGSSPYSVTATGHFVYVANVGSKNVSAYTIDGTTGALTAVLGSPFSAGSGPYSVTVDPAGHFAYVANERSNDVSAYRIDGTTGALTAVPGSPFPAGPGPASIAVDPTGHFAYVANCGSFCVGDPYDPGSISAYTIDATTGALIALPGSPFDAGYYPDSVAVLPSGRFLYVANCGNGCAGDGAFLDLGSVSAYSIDGTTGALTAVPGSPFPAGYSSMGVAATVGATNSQAAILSTSVSGLNFGGQQVNTTSAPQTVILTNTGNVPLQITSITAVPTDYAQTNNCGTSLAPNTTCSLSVTFTPSAVGNRSGQISFATNSRGGISAISVSGTGQQAAVLSVSPNSVIFANQFLKTTSAAQVIAVSNSGSTPIQITGITTAGDFAQTNNCGAAVAPNSVCNVYVTFTPSATGTRTGSMTVSANTVGAPFSVSLAGTGVYPAMSESPHSLSFGDQIVGSSSVPLCTLPGWLSLFRTSAAAASAARIAPIMRFPKTTWAKAFPQTAFPRAVAAD